MRAHHALKKEFYGRKARVFNELFGMMFVIPVLHLMSSVVTMSLLLNILAIVRSLLHPQKYSRKKNEVIIIRNKLNIFN
jgi:hypothetical protein